MVINSLKGQIKRASHWKVTLKLDNQYIISSKINLLSNVYLPTFVNILPNPTF